MTRRFAFKMFLKPGFEEEVKRVLKEVLKQHRRIIFNGDGYSEAWVREAAERGLPNYPSTVDCMPHYMDEKNVRILQKFGVLSPDEIKARTEIHLEKYSKTRRIEARVMIEMARKQLLPAALDYTHDLCSSIAVKKQLGYPAAAEESMAQQLGDLADAFYDAIQSLEQRVNDACEVRGIQAQAQAFHDSVLPEMERTRTISDTIERIMPSNRFPIPNYSAMIYNV